MKLILTLFALAGFGLISVFGLVLIPFDGSSHDMACLPSLINSSEFTCPVNNPFGFSNFQDIVLKIISNLTLGNNLGALYVLAFLISVILSLGSFFKVESYFKSAVISCSQSLATCYSQLATNLFWFSLHENSPAFA